MRKNSFHSNGSSNNGGLQAAIWMIGLGFLFLTNWWFPGILILVGLSLVVGSMTSSQSQPPSSPPFTPVPPAQPIPQQPQAVRPPAPPAVPQVVPSVTLHVDMSWLPRTCPACGAPLQPDTVVRRTSSEVDCPFCATPIRKS